MSLDLTSYLRKNSGTSSYTFYGYSNNPNAADSDFSWAIRKVTSGETTTWTNGVIDFISSWSTATQSFLTPSGTLGVTYSSNNTNYYRINWSALSGVNSYTVTTRNSNGQLLNEGGKIIERNSEFCIVEQNGKYLQITKNGEIQVQHVICD